MFKKSNKCLFKIPQETVNFYWFFFKALFLAIDFINILFDARNQLFDLFYTSEVLIWLLLCMGFVYVFMVCMIAFSPYSYIPFILEVVCLPACLPAFLYVYAVTPILLFKTMTSCVVSYKSYSSNLASGKSLWIARLAQAFYK